LWAASGLADTSFDLSGFVGAQKSFLLSYSFSSPASNIAFFRVLEVIREQEPKPRENIGWGPWSSVLVCDINPAMLEVGKKRAKS
jgi:hypothetical protein